MLRITLDRQIGPDRFQVARVTYAGVHKAAGYARHALCTRLQYKINGKVVCRAVFFAIMEAAQGDHAAGGA